jgi:NAD+ kinase
LKKRVEKLRRIGLTTNPEKIGARDLIRRAARDIERTGRVVLTDKTTAPLVESKSEPFSDLAALAAECDLLIVFGGDGTMLGASRAMAGIKTPILGVNIGGLGFLTALSSQQLRGGLEQLWEGAYDLQERSLIECKGESGQTTIVQLALNDFVISRGATPRLIELEVAVNGEALTNYRCDGLIISSPTGSTAYSLAAGGAIVTPDAPVLTITPICPHTLSNRSVIVGSNAIVEVTVLSSKIETFLTADGQVQLPMVAGNRVAIRKSSKMIRLARVAGTSFFTTLRQKLHWRGSTV